MDIEQNQINVDCGKQTKSEKTKISIVDYFSKKISRQNKGDPPLHVFLAQGRGVPPAQH